MPMFPGEQADVEIMPLTSPDATPSRWSISSMLGLSPAHSSHNKVAHSEQPNNKASNPEEHNWRHSLFEEEGTNAQNLPKKQLNLDNMQVRGGRGG